MHCARSFHYYYWFINVIMSRLWGGGGGLLNNEISLYSLRCDLLLSQSGGDTKVIYFYASVLISFLLCLWMLSAHLHRLSGLSCVMGKKKSIGLQWHRGVDMLKGSRSGFELEGEDFLCHLYVDIKGKPALLRSSCRWPDPYCIFVRPVGLYITDSLTAGGDWSNQKEAAQTHGGITCRFHRDIWASSYRQLNPGPSCRDSSAKSCFSCAASRRTPPHEICR